VAKSGVVTKAMILATAAVAASTVASAPGRRSRWSRSGAGPALPSTLEEVFSVGSMAGAEWETFGTSAASLRRAG